MSRKFPKLPSLSNVAAGNTATLELPLGLTYQSLHFLYTGVTLAQLKNIRVEVNGKPIREYTDGNELLKENDYYGYGTEAGTLDIHFKRDEMKTLEEARSFSLGTSSKPYQVGQQMVTPPAIANVTIRMDIDAGAASPTLEAYAIQSPASPIGFITKKKNFPKQISVGVTEIDNLPRPNTARIGAFHVVTAAAITKIEVEMDSIKIFELPVTLAKKVQSDHGRAPQADRYVVDFMQEGDLLQALPMAGVQDLRLRIFSDDSAPASVQVHYLDGLPGI
ncbi:major capsid protein P2 [Shewanella algae]|uniref:major capsid protein P2 n=1 Tax=Shewanella algae TaxID=38313 RepID=UPI00313E25D8